MTAKPAPKSKTRAKKPRRLTRQQREDRAFALALKKVRANAPKTLDEALDRLDKDLSATDREWMKSIDRDTFLGTVHHVSGQAMRNNWGLWLPEQPLTQWFKANLGLGHADDMSGIILGAFHARVSGQPFDIAAEVESYRAHWKQQGCNPDGSPISGVK